MKRGSVLVRLVACLCVIALSAGCITASRPQPGDTADDIRVRQLPVVAKPIAYSTGDTMALLITGDGGWAFLDNHFQKHLAGYGIPIVGLSSFKYFHKKRTPDEASRDIASILRHYLAAWHKDRIILMGYSFGADVLPYIASRLPDDLRKHVAVVAMLGASQQATFDVKLTDTFTGGHRHEGYPTKPEMKRLKGMHVICIYGDREKDSLCKYLDPEDAKLFKMHGAHHFGKNYTAMTDIIVRESAAH